MDLWHIKHQSKTCTADLDSRQCWRAEKCRFQHIESLGVKNYFLVAYEQYQNGPAESMIDSLMILIWTQMVESGLMGDLWYQALVKLSMSMLRIREIPTLHDCIKTTPHYFIHGEPKNLSKLRAFGCRAYPYLNEDRREKGNSKHIPRAVDGVNVGFSQESSGYFIYIYTNIAESHGNQSRQIWWELFSLSETISDWVPC